MEAEEDNRQIQAVRAWWEKGGYPLEYAAEAAFFDVGFDVLRGLYYDDIDKEGRPTRREMDVVARRRATVQCRLPNGHDLRVNVTLAFFLECKHSATDQKADDRIGRPWIVAASPRYRYWDEGGLVLPVASGLGEYAICALAERHGGLLLPMFKLPERPCYGVASAHGPSGYDPAYEALHQAIKGAHSWMPKRLHPGIPTELFIGFPVVVSDNDVFESWVENRSPPDRDEDWVPPPQFQRRPTIRLYWHGSSLGSGRTAVDIVTKKGLVRYAILMFHGCQELLQLLQEHLPQWVSDIVAAGDRVPFRVHLEQVSLRAAERAKEDWESRYGPVLDRSIASVR